MLRPSRSPRVFAMFVTIRKIQVFRDARPSNRPIPEMTPSHASWTTSSATARDDTYIRATRSIDGLSSVTRSEKARSSPRLRAPTVAACPGGGA